jgi:uncharacterized protein YndB with AHSA1/START domain
VDLRVECELACPPDTAFEHLADLDRYPHWLGLVRRADPAGDGAWMVELRAKVGPLARSKRLRMVRSELVTPERVVFERAELDDRPHAMWKLTTEVTPTPAGCVVVADLHYSGAAWVPLLDQVLAGEVDRAKRNLSALVS